MEPYTAKTHAIHFSREKKHVYCPYRCLYVISCWYAILKDHARETPTSASPTLPKPSNGTWILRAIRVDWFDGSFGTINVEESLIHLGGFGTKHGNTEVFSFFFWHGWLFKNMEKKQLATSIFQHVPASTLQYKMHAWCLQRFFWTTYCSFRILVVQNGSKGVKGITL